MRYVAFADPSGGSHDSFTVSIAHKEGPRVVVDVCRGVQPPFDPVTRGGRICRSAQGVSLLTLLWAISTPGTGVVESFRKVGIRYEHSESNEIGIGT